MSIAARAIRAAITGGSQSGRRECSPFGLASAARLGPARPTSRSRLGVEQDVADVDRADAVDHRMMGLGREHPSASVETIDKRHLPQWAAAVEPVRPEVGEPFVDLCISARGRERRVAHLGAQVELRLLDPGRAAESVRARLREPAAIPRQTAQALVEQRAQLLERGRAAGRQRVEDQRAADVHHRALVGLLELKEGGIERGEAALDRTHVTTLIGRAEPRERGTPRPAQQNYRAPPRMITAVLLPMPTITTILLLSVDEAPMLERSLPAATEQADSHVVVVDNASADATGELAERYGAECLGLERPLSYAAAINEAIARTGGEALLLLNADCVLAPGFVPAAAHHLFDPSLRGSIRPTNPITGPFPVGHGGRISGGSGSTGP